MGLRFVNFILLLFLFPQYSISQVCQKSQLPANLQSGLVAYYPFCGNLNDISGNNFNGVAQSGAVPYITDRLGNPNGAVQLGGGYITTSPAVFNFQRNQSFSVSIWFTKDNNAPSGRLLSNECPEGNFRIGASFNGVYAVQYGDYIFDTVNIGQWNHLVYTYENRNERVYINGVLKYTNNDLSTEALNFCAPFTIGAKASSAFDRWVGKADDIAVYNRVLSESEVRQLFSGASCSGNLAFDVFRDTTNAIGVSTILDAGAGFTSYLWNTGATTKNVEVNSNGFYKVTVTDQSGCTASDSTYLNLICAKILQNDTTICKGSSISLSIDSNFNIISNSSFSNSLRNGLVAYYPFNGNANDESGNGNNGIVNGAILTADRFGNKSAAYYFNNNYISANINTSTINQGLTISVWVLKSGPGFIGPRILEFLGTNGNPDNTGSAQWIWSSTDRVFGSFTSNNTPVFSQFKNVDDNIWTNLTYTLDSSFGSFYQDGVLLAKLPASGNPILGGNVAFGRMNHPAYDALEGKLDDIGIWNRVLSTDEVQAVYKNGKSISWSTGASSNSITVSPTQTTKYYVTVSDGINSCQDSVTVNVVDDSAINTLSDTIRVCGNSATLTSGNGFDSFIWNTGATTQTITPTSSGFYKVTGIKGSCSVSDSTYLSLVQAKILQRDTTICKGSSITLSTSTSNNSTSACASTQLPANLQNGLIAYFPFCGNANDASGNGNNGVVNGASLTTDRFGNINSAYNFDGNSQYISVIANNLPQNERTISAWINIPIANYVGMLMSYGGNGICGTSYFVGINHRGSNQLMVSGHCANNETQANYIPPINQWVNIVCVSSSSGTKIFANGILVGSSSAFFSSTIGSKLFIGSSIDFSGVNPYIDPNGLWWLGKIDDFIIWNRALTETEVKSLHTLQKSITWSTGDTTQSITLTPTQTTKYFVTVSDGITSCTDSILVKVDDLSSFNPLPDTISQCGKNILLDAGTKYSNYSWSNGDTTPSIQVNMGGRYFVTVKDSIGCSASDSTYLSLVNANILQNDTIICNGGSITLSVDTVFKVINTYGTTLPTNLKNDLVAYYPFNGNANDESGNGNNATVFNAKLTTDRFGRPNSAYSFSPANRSSIVAGVLNKTMVNSFTYSVWVRPLNTIVVPAQGQSSNAASGFPNNTCVIHPIHGQNYGPPNSNTGTGVYVGTNGVYLEEHSDGWEAVPISHQMDLSGWHLINIVYENKVPSLYIDGVFIKKGFSSSRQIYASLGPDNYPIYVRSGIGAGYLPTSGTTQYFNGDIDDIFYYKRALNANEVNQIYNGSLNIKWSTGDTTSSIKVNPSVTTKYFVTVSDGITSCTDSILVKVSNLSTFNPFPDTLSQCGKSLNLDAGGSYSSYKWNNGASTQAITVNKSGYYNVNVTDADGCLASDTTLVSLVYVNIDNSDTTVCAPANITLKISDTLVSQKGGWELLIPSTSFNFSETNFREGGFDPENAKLYSVFKNGSVNRFYEFDLNQNTVQSVGSLGAPSELYDYVYDFTNSRIIATRVGRDRMYTIPLTGGTWTPFGNGSFDAESYGCATFWNPVSKRPGFFGGYGFFSVKNWIWENSGNGGWQNVFANTNNCQPPKRTGQIARNKLGDKIYIFSGQGSCDGNQFATSCSISQPWATDVGIYCWLKDLWELDLNTYTFKNILPPNSPSIINEGAFSYDYNNDVFYNIGGYKPLPTSSPSATANIDYGVEVYRFRRGVDNGFELMPVDGIKPPVLKLSQYSGRTYYDAKNNRVIWARNDGIWALNLGASSSASYKYKWSTGDTTTTINVNPTQTTTYYVSVTDGITTCKDSIKVTVEQPARGIRYPTQDLIINRPATLNARTFGRTYLWSPDVQLNSPRLITPIITPAKQQQYTVTITTAGGCVTVDSVLVRVFPNINIYVPDGFSPDGDGRNDKLYPIPIGIREIRMFRVFNRWGTLVYDNKNANVNTGWDGTYLRSAQPMESYVWIAEGIDNDGNFIRRTGNTILIR